MNFDLSRQILEKYLNIKFHKNPSSGTRVIPSVRTDRRTDTKKLIVAFRNFANAPKNTLFGQRAEFINVTDCDAHS